MSGSSVPVQPFLFESNQDPGAVSRYRLDKPQSLVAGGQPGGPKQFKLRAFLFKLMGPPGIVVCGQMILLITAWGFFGVVQTRKFIALPDSTAIWVNAHTRLVTFIFTMISTGLSFCSSFLFSWGVRQSITLRLRGDGMPLVEFISSVKISSQSVTTDAQNRKWTAMSIAVLILTVVQTSCWSGLITPSQIDFEAPLNGTEIDLTNARLQSLQSTGALDFCVFKTADLASFYVGQTESGYAALKGDIGLTGILTLMDQAFNHSTSGILPQTLYPVNTSSWFPSPNIETIPQNIDTDVDLPEGLSSFSYTVTQQGFSADVSCEFGDLPADTTVQPVVAEDIGVTLYTMSSTCVSPAVPQGPVSSTLAYTTGDPNYILMVACGADSDTYTLIFQGLGTLYEFMHTMICTVAPKVTSVRVDYSANGAINSTQWTDGVAVDATGPAGLTALTTIYEMMLFAQGTRTNVVGDEIKTVIAEVDSQPQDDLVLEAVEEYIRGVTEYSGSVLRACLSAPNGAFPEGVPEDMAIHTTGTLHGQIVGWREISLDTFYVMIPGTLVAIATIWVVLSTLAQYSGNSEGGPFDPANIMHIVTASAAGGLPNVFTGPQGMPTMRLKNAHVILQSLAARPPALYVQPSRQEQECTREPEPESESLDVAGGEGGGEKEKSKGRSSSRGGVIAVGGRGGLLRPRTSHCHHPNLNSSPRSLPNNNLRPHPLPNNSLNSYNLNSRAEAGSSVVSAEMAGEPRKKRRSSCGSTFIWRDQGEGARGCYVVFVVVNVPGSNIPQAVRLSPRTSLPFDYPIAHPITRSISEGVLVPLVQTRRSRSARPISSFPSSRLLRLLVSGAFVSPRLTLSRFALSFSSRLPFPVLLAFFATSRLVASPSPRPSCLFRLALSGSADLSRLVPPLASFSFRLTTSSFSFSCRDISRLGSSPFASFPLVFLVTFDSHRLVVEGSRLRYPLPDVGLRVC
ncbi:hypothetical protein C8R45DRAFT_1103010 [Mycena sanguinolenta]|nr:hypothetical protein C8R45DRAFT_1103010 [Mycena sanguinolenta]